MIDSAHRQWGVRLAGIAAVLLFLVLAGHPGAVTLGIRYAGHGRSDLFPNRVGVEILRDIRADRDHAIKIRVLDRGRP